MATITNTIRLVMAVLVPAVKKQRPLHPLRLRLRLHPRLRHLKYAGTGLLPMRERLALRSQSLNRRRLHPLRRLLRLRLRPRQKIPKKIPVVMVVVALLPKKRSAPRMR